MKYTAILDFGSKKIQCLIRAQMRTGETETAGQASQHYAGLRMNAEPDFSSIQQTTLLTLEATEREAKCDMEQVVVGVPGIYTSVTCRKTDMHFDTARPIEEKDIQAAIEKSIRSIRDSEHIVLHSIPVYYLFDGETHEDIPEGKMVQSIEVIVAHILMKREFQEMVATIFLGSGYKVSHFVDALLAEALYVIPDAQLKKDTIVIDVGGYHTDVRVMRKKAAIFHKSLAIGGEHLTNDLKLVTGMTQEAAEKIKKYYVFGMDYDEGAENCRMEGGGSEEVPCRLIQDIIEARVSELLSMILTTIREAPIDYKPGTAIVLAGNGLAPIRGSVEFFQRMADFPVSAPLPTELPPNSYGLCSVYGIAEYAPAEEEEPTKKDWKETSFFKKLLHFFTE